MRPMTGIFRGWTWMLLAGALAAPAALAQDGPPPHVRRAVDAVMAMLDSEGEGPLREFATSAMVPPDVGDAAARVRDLAAVREAVRGLRDGIAVEAEPDGIRLILAGGGVERQVRVVLDERGISEVALVAPGGAAVPAGGRRAAVLRHARAIEDTPRGTLAEAVARFESDHLSASYLVRTSPEDRRALLSGVREAAASAGNVSIDERDAGIVVRLSGEDGVHEVEFAVEDDEPFGIAALTVREVEDEVGAMALSREDLAGTFDRLEAEGLSGVVHVRLDGEVVYERAFGKANAELGIPIRRDTVFGTGSRPIDYTRAAVLLLDQRGELDLDATLDTVLPNVPADKRAMTLRHLMDGRSGLPDFFHEAGDWDADLAWIDRAEAERRILALPLRFAPGTDRRHSHAAFVLLAAIVERASGTSYERFLRENFFDPAGMTRTGFYGDARGLALGDFAVGGGPSFVGLPNIPPNWGPTSWLVMGSGGMVSTLPDQLRFYDLVRSDRVLDDAHAAPFRLGFASRDGSDRGFELFQAYVPPGNEVHLMVNVDGRDERVRSLTRALARLVGFSL